MAVESLDVLPRLRVPQLDSTVIRTRGQQAAVRRESHTSHSLRMSGKSVDYLSASHLPEAHCPIVVGRGDGPTVGTEGNRRYWPGLIRPSCNRVPSLDVPQSDGSVCAARSQPATIGAGRY